MGSFGKGNYWWEYTLPGALIGGDYDFSCKYVSVHRTQAPLRFVVVDPDGTEQEQEEVGPRFGLPGAREQDQVQPGKRRLQPRHQGILPPTQREGSGGVDSKVPSHPFPRREVTKKNPET